MVKEKENQPHWTTLLLPDLRKLDDVHLLGAPDTVDAGNTAEEALLSLQNHLGFTSEEINERTINTPTGLVYVKKGMLSHIVEKRLDARERFVYFALATMEKPFEIWKVSYDDESHRYAYIGVFSGKVNMLVIVSINHGNILWNFMHSDRKSLNKHRHGALIYQR